MPPKTCAGKKRIRRKLGARPYRNYSDEMMALAIEMVKTKKMSSYEAEKNFSIPRRTIEKKIQNIHSDKPGPRFRLTPDEELDFVEVLIVASEYGAPLTQLDLRIVVHEYLKKNNRSDIFDDKLPGEWWVKNFIERHRNKLSLRAVQNIKRARAEKSFSEFEQYFNNLKSVLENVPPTHVMNYDETNFSDDPGSVKCICRRGMKYPERVINSSKGSISVMFAATADGGIMPPYVVYKAESLWQQWVEGGPQDSRFNRTKNGWFDAVTFYDWFNSIVVPWARKLEGAKVVIGDNLSSHINVEVIKLCEKYDIRFVLLPPSSTHLTQPLDVAFFGPLKKVWRKILTTYKYENPMQTGLNKSHFPPLLAKVMDEVNMKKKENVVSGFRATGIIPFNPQKVYKRIPEGLPDDPNFTVDHTLLEYLKENRKPKEIKIQRNKKLNVEPGKSITTSDISQNLNGNTKQIKQNSKTLSLKTKKNFNEIPSEGKSTSDIRVEVCSEKIPKIHVNICGTLSDDEADKDNVNISTRKLFPQKNCKKNKKAAKRYKKKESGSSTTENTDWSEYSDKDITLVELEDSEENDNETDDDAKIRVRMIEEEIFEKISRIDRESEELNGQLINDEEQEGIKNETDLREIDNQYTENEIETIKRDNNETATNKHEDEERKQEGENHETRLRNLNERYIVKEENNNQDKEHYNMNIEMKKANKSKLGWNKGDIILTRYYSRKWKYYIGIIQNIDTYGKIYAVSYYKLTRNKNGIKFVLPKRADEDNYLPENSIVKSVELLQISENPEEYVLMNDEDNIYFD